MGISPSDAKKLSLHDYQALNFRWNERHKTNETPSDVEPLDPEIEEAENERLEAMGIRILR